MSTERLAEINRRAREKHAADNRSISHRGREVPIERLSACRLTVVQRRKDDPTKGRAVTVECKTRSCESCGPKHRQRKTDHFAGLAVKAGQLWQSIVTAEEWKRVRKHVSGEGQYVRVPIAGDRFLVLTTTDVVGVQVADPKQAVTSAFAAMVVQPGRPVTSSKKWVEPHEERPASPWTEVGATVLPVEKVAEVFRAFGALGSKLASTTAEGWHVNLPDEGDELWDLLDLRTPRSRRSRARIDPATGEVVGLSAACRAALAA